MLPLDMIATPPTAVSLLVLSDRLLALAKDADQAGFADTAGKLVTLAVSVFDEAPRPRN